ncbi:hypothetical protein ACVW0K_007421 [Streptomyces filamentosus]
MTLCTVCGDRELTGARAEHTTCAPCEDWIADHLAQARALWAQLPDHLEPGRGHSGPRVSGNTKTSGAAPVTQAVLDLIGGGAAGVLAPHETEIRRARHMPTHQYALGGVDRQFRSTLDSLERNLPWAVRNHPLWPLADALRTLVRQMRAATGDTPERERTTTELGTPCPAVRVDPAGAGSTCGGTLRYYRATHAVRCDACGHDLDQDQWLGAAVLA